MKKYFVLFSLVVFGYSLCSAQTQVRPVSIDLSARLGSRTKSLKEFTVDKLPGDLDYFSANTLGLQVDVNVHKRFTAYANYMYEHGDATKTVGRVDPSLFGFLFDLLVSAATETFPDGGSLIGQPGTTYTAKMHMHHVQFGGKLNWVAKSKFQMYSGLGLGFSGGNASYTSVDRQKKEKNIGTAPRAAFIPFGMRFGGKVKFDVNFGVGDAPAMSAGLGMNF